MEDALWAQLQNVSLEENDDRDRIEPESESDQEDHVETSVNSIPHEERQSGPNTGPKGVKADHDYHQQMQLDLKDKARADYNARMLAKAPTTTTYLQDVQEQQLILQQQQQKQQEPDDDDLKYLREKRLNELKRRARGNHSIHQQQKLFGSYRTIDIDDYVNEIEDESKTIPVIIHIFDDSLPKCKELDLILPDLAQKYFAKFIRVSANDLDFDLVGSPAILAYAGGVLIANLVRIIDEVGSRFDIDAIEDVLLRHGALSQNDLYDIPNIVSDEEQDEE
ncbi:thioredoxin-like protein [Parasitella parasitica]|nr:thioredoxin-like protein [Parasitella parasitica]